MSGIPNLIGDSPLMSIGLNFDNRLSTPTQDPAGRIEDHRYVFPRGFLLKTITDGTTIEEVRAPLRDLAFAPQAYATSKIVRIGGTVGGSGGAGGWFQSSPNVYPTTGTFYPEGPIIDKDSCEQVLQRIADVFFGRGPANLRLGHADNRWLSVTLKSWSVEYAEGTDRNVFDVTVEFEAADPYFIGPNWNYQLLSGLSGSATVAVGSTAKTWPIFWLNISGTAPVWVGVQYASGQIVALTTPHASVPGNALQFVTEPRYRGVYPYLYPGFRDRDPVMTAMLNCQNTVPGDVELMPYLLPGNNTVIWHSTAADVYVGWYDRYAF